MRWRWKLALLLTVLCGVGACRKREVPLDQLEELAQYAALPGIQKSHDAELQAELARLLTEGATPLQLVETERRRNGVASDESYDSVAALDQLFPAPFRESLRSRLNDLWPARSLYLPHASLHVAAELGKTHSVARESFSELVLSPSFHLSADHTKGVTAVTGHLDVIEIGCRLQGLRAAELLADDQVDAAIEPLQVMFRAAEVLGRVGTVVSRGAAARRRGEALQVLDAIAQHPRALASTQGTLATLLTHQLERWPHDADAWIGDRAQGLHTYELIRDGYLLSLLSYDELRAYRDDVGIQKLAQLVAANIDRDELFYLRTMRDVIEACDRPYHARRHLFTDVVTNLGALRSGDAYPFVADQFLLLQLDEGHRLQALDRARCEARLLALRIARGQQDIPQVINPLTGEPFLIKSTQEAVVVDGIDPSSDEPPARVPLRPDAP